MNEQTSQIIVHKLLTMIKFGPKLSSLQDSEDKWFLNYNFRFPKSEFIVKSRYSVLTSIISIFIKTGQIIRQNESWRPFSNIWGHSRSLNVKILKQRLATNSNQKFYDFFSVSKQVLGLNSELGVTSDANAIRTPIPIPYRFKFLITVPNFII